MVYNSQVILAKNIKIDRSYKNVLTYTESQMLSLCQTNAIYSNNTYEFLKENESPIYVGCNYSTAIQANYIAFQNPNFSNKWFFGFIDRVEYNSVDSVMIHYTVDVFATWFDYWSKLPCYVIREHTNDDTIGENTIDENLNVGEIVAENEIEVNFIDRDCYVCVATNWDISYTNGQGGSIGIGYNGVSAYNKNVFGQLLCFFDLSESGLYNLEHFLFITNSEGHIEDLHDMFIVPKSIFGENDLEQKNVTYESSLFSDPVLCGYKELRYDSQKAFTPFYDTVDVPNINAYSDYTPKNNKCFVYPYNYITITNNIGSQNIYKYEDFNDMDVSFLIEIALSIGMSGRIIPIEYRGQTNNIDESLTLAKFPTCSWSSDSYTNWLTDNAVNIAQQVLGIGTQIVAGNGIGATGTIMNLIGEFRKANLLPEITGGTSSGDVNFAGTNNHFKIIQNRCKTEFLRTIDDYFTKYGYKTIRVKLANITGRQNWNFVQIGNDEIIGSSNNHNGIPVPTSDMEKINDIFKSGVTCWHNHDNIGNYNLTNNIV